MSVLPIYLLLLVTAMSFSVKTNMGSGKFNAANATFVQKVTISINGTSTLHDWEMKSDKGSVEVSLGIAGNGKLIGLTGLKFSMEAESLKSDKTMMDNNAYKALKTASSKNIVFVLSSSGTSQLNETTYQIKAVGKLTIAGTTRETDVIAIVKYNAADKSYSITGTKKLKMTEYNVKPPSFMLGTVKTGDEISISFKTKLAQ